MVTVKDTLQTWTVADAKARFSEVIERAQTDPQIITRHGNGKPSAVLVSAHEWAQKTARRGTLAEFLLASPLSGADLDLERVCDRPREVITNPCIFLMTPIAFHVLLVYSAFYEN
ncbi:MAG: type II toxin-antitoxin system Phd/YefM family antitoxin [Alphaproteobacteria bacterium]|nr:type II toxin-antitoxin system Phd/YefM family antitoxin [Alphaproteobacteria bacterium]